MNSFSARGFGFIIKKLVFGFLFDFCFSFFLFFFFNCYGKGLSSDENERCLSEQQQFLSMQPCQFCTASHLH